jgi:single-strand DNA-binding protein
VLWRGLAEVAQKYLKKGSTIFIEGKIRSRSWEDKEGNKKYITEVVADNMTMLNRKDDHNNINNGQEKTLPAAVEPAQEAGDDLPF